MNTLFSAPAAAIILIITVVASIAALSNPRLLGWALFRPYWLVRRREYEKLITSGFVHADYGHLLFNGITFWFFAFTLERRIGSLAFVSLYFIGMVLSELGTYIKHRNNENYASLGASGAILAVLFAYICYFPTAKLMMLFLPIPIPAPLFAVLYLAYSYYAAHKGADRVNHDAHIGGAITGLAFVAITDPRAFRRLLEVVF